MRERSDSRCSSYGYGPDKCQLSFEVGDFPQWTAEGNDLYWKIGLTVENLDAAAAYLQQQGWPVTEPRQFQQIGYLCHLQDSSGNAIELLQQGFEGRQGGIPTGHPVGSQATLAHITLRVGNIEASRAYLEDELKLRLMSIQPVPEYGFTLYFFSWSEEALPNPDLEAVENREWLWARPYPLLELQHFHQEVTIRRPEGAVSGFAGLSFNTDLGKDEPVDLSRIV